MYEFMNDKSKLQTLKASGTGGILVFETETEKAYVSLSNNSIDEVLHIYKPNGIATIFFEKDVFQLEVGEGNNKRTVKHYLKPNKDAPHLQLRLGITEHSSCGSWSSLPHDFENNPEPGFEEVFFYMINDSKQSEGKAIQTGRGMWADGSTVDDLWNVKDQTFSVVPMGYHAVVGEPNAMVRYVWSYIAKKPEWEKI